MGLWARLKMVFRAKAGKALGKMEDPRELLDLSYEKQLELLQKVRKGIAEVTAAKARITMQSKRLEDQVAKLDDQARRAVGAGREDLARLALERKKETQTQLQDLDTQIAQVSSDQEKLKASEQQLQARIESFRMRKETTKAQYTAAEARVKIGEAVSGLGDEMGNVGLALERAQEKTDEMTAKAGAIDELLAAGTLPDLGAPRDQIEAELQKHARDSDVELELAELRKELGPGETSGEAPSA